MGQISRVHPFPSLRALRDRLNRMVGAIKNQKSRLVWHGKFQRYNASGRSLGRTMRLYRKLSRWLK
jgi:hypothetical protein